MRPLLGLGTGDSPALRKMVHSYSCKFSILFLFPSFCLVFPHSRLVFNYYFLLLAFFLLSKAGSTSLGCLTCEKNNRETTILYNEKIHWTRDFELQYQVQYFISKMNEKRKLIHLMFIFSAFTNNRKSDFCAFICCHIRSGSTNIARAKF